MDRIALGDLQAAAAALGARLELDLQWRGAGLDRLVDERHTALVDDAVRLFRAAGWETAVEVSFSIYGERGSIDVLSRHSATGLLAVCEIKATVPEAGNTLIGVDSKARLAPSIAAERGWACRGVARFLIVADTSSSRGRIQRHGDSFRTAFPSGTRASLAWIRDPLGPPPSGIIFITPRGSRRSGTGGVSSRGRRGDG